MGTIDMDKMTDQEKSVMLARAMGWKFRWDQRCFKPNGDYPTWRYDLYAPENMALAWKCHLWALSGSKNERAVLATNYAPYWRREMVWMKAEAQRLWLDQILTLCIEANLIEVNND